MTAGQIDAPREAQLDDWGRDLALLRPARGEPAPVPALFASPAADQLLLDDLAEMRQRLRALEERVVANMAGEPAVLNSSAWARRLAQAIADHWDVSVFEVLGKTRRAAVIRPRFAFCWLLREVTGFSYLRLAHLAGYDDHTSVMHACRRVDGWRETDEAMRWATDQLFVIALRLRGERTPRASAIIDGDHGAAEGGA